MSRMRTKKQKLSLKKYKNRLLGTKLQLSSICTRLVYQVQELVYSHHWGQKHLSVGGESQSNRNNEKNRSKH